jgi:FkbM family methyltransferase
MHIRGGADQIARDLFRSGWQGFEWPVPEVFARWVSVNEGVVLDVGANTGFYALVAAQVSPASTVHAFEPFPAAIVCLQQNLALNRALGSRVEVFPYAVSDVAGEAPLFVPDPGHGLVETSCSLNSQFKERVVDQVPVPVVTLDAHVEGLGRPVVSAVKIDVESLEHRVLAGADRLLARDRPVVFLEVLPSGDPVAIEAVRQRHGYVAVRLRPGSAMVGHPVEHDPQGWNQALVPDEKAGLMGEALAASGLVAIGDRAGA